MPSCERSRCARRTKQGYLRTVAQLLGGTAAPVDAVARRVAIVAVLGIHLGACSALPGDGPWMGGVQSTSPEALPFDVIDLTPMTIASFGRSAALDRPFAAGKVSATERLTVAPGDLLKVRIFERYAGNIFPTIQGQGGDLGIRRVGQDGTIQVPFVGVVAVSGLTLHEIEVRIRQQLGSRVQEPEVIVEFDAAHSHSLSVSGEVKQPGRISTLDDVRTVTDAINKAGGPLTPASASSSASSTDSSSIASLANQLQVVLRRGGQIILASQFSDLLAGGDIAVRSGDEIVVRSNARIYTVLGATQLAGNVEMSKDSVPLMQALGNARGLSDGRANKTGVYVFRMGDLEANASARARIFRLDLSQPVSIFVAQQFAVQARDVIYVTNAPLYEYDKMLTTIYRTYSIIGTAKGVLRL